MTQNQIDDRLLLAGFLGVVLAILGGCVVVGWVWARVFLPHAVAP